MSLSPNGTNEDVTHTAAGRVQTLQGSCEGTIINVRDNKLLMRIANGEERSHNLAKAVQLSCDGDVCAANSLKIGYRVRVSTQPNDRNLAIRVEAIDVDTHFSIPPSGEESA
jgi:hypothetical protein